MTPKEAAALVVPLLAARTDERDDVAEVLTLEYEATATPDEYAEYLDIVGDMLGTLPSPYHK
jgi:hypothetical protein